MNRLRQVSDIFSRWIDAVAATVHALLNRWSPQRVVRITEEEQGAFALQAFGDAKDLILPDQQILIADGAMTGTLSEDWKTWLRGSRAEVILRPGRFMFRPLELPKRAGEFLEGIVRSQIDRLTPWSANEAAYTWTPPVEAANDRIQLTVAATARSKLTPYVRALAALGVASVIVSTVPQDADVGSALKVYEQRNGGTIEVTRIRQILDDRLSRRRGARPGVERRVIDPGGQPRQRAAGPLPQDHRTTRRDAQECGWRRAAYTRAPQADHAGERDGA